MMKKSHEKTIRKSTIKGIFFLIFLFLNLIKVSGQIDFSDSLANERLKEIQFLLNHDRLIAQRWWYGWIWGYNAATVGQGIVFFSTEKLATRQDMALGAATTILGALSLIVTPIVPSNSNVQDNQDSQSNSLSQYNNPDSFEETLKEIARREKLGRSWKSHAICGVANIGSGLVTWIGFNRTFKDGLVNFALNTVITEAQIWTQPTRAIKDYQNYYRKYYPESGKVDSKQEIEWFVHVYPGRISFGLDF